MNSKAADALGAEQKAHRSIRARRPHVELVSQVSLDLPCLESTEDTFRIAQNEVLRWLNNRSGRTLPEPAWRGESFILDELGAQNTEAIKLTDSIWAARLNDADKDVPQRFWTTEFSIKVDPEPSAMVHFGCRLFCTAHGDNPEFVPTIPGVVRQINDRLGGQIDGRPLSQRSWYIQNQDSVSDLMSLLLDPSRQRAVVVISAPPYGEPELVDFRRLARWLTGVAHVVRLSSEASYMLTNEVGREFSVFSGAVRTYRPGFQPDVDQPSEHPLATFSRIRYWDDDARTFEHFLISRTVDADLSRRRIRTELPSFTDIQGRFAQMERTRLREEGASDSQLLALAEGQIQELEGKIEENEQLLVIAEEERDAIDLELDEAKDAIYKLRTRIEYLETTRTETTASETALPSALDELEDWADKHLSGSIHILNRAYRAAKKTEFDDATFVYRALCILRDYYVPMRKGIKTKEEFDAACQEVGLEETATFTGSTYGEEGDTYFVKFRGQRKLLERHLKNGNTRDPRRSFRLYFFWDNDSQQIVVGSLPSHLDSRAT